MRIVLVERLYARHRILHGISRPKRMAPSTSRPEAARAEGSPGARGASETSAHRLLLTVAEPEFSHLAGCGTLIPVSFGAHRDGWLRVELLIGSAVHGRRQGARIATEWLIPGKVCDVRAHSPPHPFPSHSAILPLCVHE
jgi:hypothetical protein